MCKVHWQRCEINALIPASRNLQGRIRPGHQRLQAGHEIRGPYSVLQFDVVDVDFPTDIAPVRPGRAELCRFRCLVGCRLGDAYSLNVRFGERKHEVAWSDVPHELLKGIALVVRLSLWRPALTNHRHL